MKLKQYIVLGIFSFIFFIGVAAIGGYAGHDYKFLAATLLYCLMTFLLLKRVWIFKQKLLLIFLIAWPILFLDISHHIFNFEDTLISLPSSAGQLIGILFGCLIYTSSRKIQVILVSILILSSFWIAFKGYDLWLNKLNFGTYTGAENEMAPSFSLKDSDGKTFTNSAFISSITVLDFWNTSCGACFKKFPILQKKFDDYRPDTIIKIFAVNIPLKRDTVGQAERILKLRGYTFPNLIADSDSVANSFKIKSFPTTIIIDKSGNIIYRGKIDNIDKVILKIKMDASLK